MIYGRSVLHSEYRSRRAGGSLSGGRCSREPAAPARPGQVETFCIAAESRGAWGQRNQW